MAVDGSRTDVSFQEGFFFAVLAKQNGHEVWALVLSLENGERDRLDWMLSNTGNFNTHFHSSERL